MEPPGKRQKVRCSAVRVCIIANDVTVRFVGCYLPYLETLAVETPIFDFGHLSDIVSDIQPSKLRALTIIVSLKGHSLLGFVPSEGSEFVSVLETACRD
jgi:hypothetical protein